MQIKQEAMIKPSQDRVRSQSQFAVVCLWLIEIYVTDTLETHTANWFFLHIYKQQQPIRGNLTCERLWLCSWEKTYIHTKITLILLQQMKNKKTLYVNPAAPNASLRTVYSIHTHASVIHVHLWPTESWEHQCSLEDVVTELQTNKWDVKIKNKNMTFFYIIR